MGREPSAVGDADGAEVAARILAIVEEGRAYGMVYSRTLAVLADLDPGRLGAVYRQLDFQAEPERNDLDARRAVLDLWAEHEPAEAYRYLSRTESRDADRLMATVFEAWGARDADAALAATIADSSERGSQRIANLLHGWAKKDPERALRMFEDLARGPLRDRTSTGYVYSSHGIISGGGFRGPPPARSVLPDLMKAVIEPWAAQDPAGAAAALARLADDPLGRFIDFGVYNGLAFRWASADPAAAYAWASGIADLEQRKSNQGYVLSTWAASDPAAAAAAAARDLPPGHRRSQVVAGIAYQWFPQEPDRALAWLEASLSGKPKAHALQRLFGLEEVREQPELMADIALRISPSSKTSDPIVHAATNWARRDLETAMDWAEGIGNPSRRGFALAGVLEEWAKVDALAAAEYLSAFDGWTPPDAARKVAFAWAENDPAAAVGWAETLEDGEASQRAVRSVVTRWVERDIAAAAAYVAGMAPGKHASELASSVASRIARDDPEAAAEWVVALEDKEMFTRAFSSVVQDWARADPAAAAAAVETYLEGREAQARAANVARYWAEKDVAAAATWAGSHPEPEVRARIAGAVAASWVRRDLRSVLAWADGLEEAASRDSAVAEVIRTLAATDPASALTWAGSIADPDRRTRELTNVIRAWGKVDAGAAREALEEAAIPEARKAVLRRGFP